MKKLIVLGFLFLVLAFSAYAVPSLDSIADKTLNEGETLSFDISASNSENIDVTFTGNGSFTSVSQTNNSLATVTLSPGLSDSGNYDMKFELVDQGNQSLYDTKTITVSVNDVSLSVGSPDIGSPSTRRSNPKADDKDERYQDDDDEFAIQNTGNVTIRITGISTNLDSTRYNTSFPGLSLPIELIPGESHTVTILTRIPEDLDSFFPDRDDDTDRKVNVGQLTVSTNTSASQTAEIYMEAENQLEFDQDLEFMIDGETKRYDDDDSVKNIRPGSKIEMIISAENNFDSSDKEDLAIEDVDAQVTVPDELDIDEEETIGDIGPKEDDSITIEFEIDEDAENNDGGEMVVIVSGRDENGALHGEKWKLTFEVKRESKEILVTDVDYSEIICSDESFDLSITIKNTGRNNDDEVSLKVSSTDFSYTKRIYDIDLDTDDDTTRTFNIPIPSDLSEGSHFITITPYNDRTDANDPKVVSVEYPTCEEEQEPEQPEEEDEEEDEVDVVIQNDTTTDEDLPPIIPGGDGTETIEGAGLNQNMIMIILIVAIVITVASLVTVFIVLFRGKGKGDTEE